MPAIPTMVGGADTQRHQILARLIYTKEPFSEKKKMVGRGFWQDVLKGKSDCA